jgi:hypothetical protein
MNDGRFTPEALGRLVALPEDHPERVAAVASPQFEAYRRMLADFERPGDALVADAELDAARAELMSRLADAGHIPPRTATPAAAPEASRTVRPLPRPGVLAWLTSGGGRPALAVAGALIVVGFGWWATQRPARDETTRGIADLGAFELTTKKQGDSLVLSWNAVEGADRYRVVFLGAGLAEVAHQDVPTGTSLALRAGALPAGVAPRSRVSIEIVALKMGGEIATSPARTLLLP